MNELAPLDRWIDGAIRAFSARERKALFGKIIRNVQKWNRLRIGKEVNPDGSAWEERKPDGRGQVRSTAKMLQGLRDTRRMLAASDADGGEIRFRGKKLEKIASVHHFGEVDAVEPGGPSVRYAERQVLGLSDADHTRIHDQLREHVLDHLSR